MPEKQDERAEIEDAMGRLFASELNDTGFSTCSETVKARIAELEEKNRLAQDLYMRYLGVLGILTECSPQVDNGIRDEAIQTAFDDAVEMFPHLKTRRILNRIIIEVQGNAALDAEKEKTDDR